MTYKKFNRLECTTGTSNKYWECWIEKKEEYYIYVFVSHWGRIGTAGTYNSARFSTLEKAVAALEKTKADKLKKGYKLVKGTKPITKKTKPNAKKLASNVTDINLKITTTISADSTVDSSRAKRAIKF